MQQAGARYCQNCGGPLGAQDRFCGGCGRPVDRGTPMLWPVNLAAYPRRVIAWAIDVIIVWGVLIGMLLALLSTASSDSSGQTTGVGFFIWPVLPLYPALLHAFWHGQTIGKRLLGIAVTREDGAPISLGQSLGRAYLRAGFWVVPPVWLADSLWPLWQARRQSLHDLAADTIVQRLG